MKPMPTLSFSSDINKFEYHYIPQPHQYSDPLAINPIYERSLSSSILPFPNFTLSLSIHSSLDFGVGTGGGTDREPNITEGRDCGRSQDRELEGEEKNNGGDKTKMEYEGCSFVALQLQHLVPNRKQSTKNILRNFGNAQNQYILHNPRIQQDLAQQISSVTQFQSWLRKLKLLNFSDYKSVWSLSSTESPTDRKFKKLYRRYCWKFYEEECLPYIFGSRLTDDNKKSHLLKINRMMEGILQPQQFQGFRP